MERPWPFCASAAAETFGSFFFRFSFILFPLKENTIHVLFQYVRENGADSSIFGFENSPTFSV